MNIKREAESQGSGDSDSSSSSGGGRGYSLSFVLNMLEDLWTKAIEEYLEIERKDFKVRVK